MGGSVAEIDANTLGISEKLKIKGSTLFFQLTLMPRERRNCVKGDYSNENFYSIDVGRKLKL